MFTVVQRYYDNGNIMVSLRRAFSDEVLGMRKEYFLDSYNVFIDVFASFDDAMQVIAKVKDFI